MLTQFFKPSLKSIIEDSQSIYGKAFAFSIQALIVLSLVTFSIDTLPDLSDKTRGILSIIELITVVIFTLEYVFRILVADRKVGFIFSFYGLIDLMAILPFHLASGVDLRAVRIFRLLRLIRILKLVRYNQAVGRFHRALVIAKEELILFSFVALMMLYLSAVGIYYFEHQAQPEQFGSVFHGLWWAVTTLTTVSYGDVYPITVGGKVLTFVILAIGLGVVAIPTGLLASALSAIGSNLSAWKKSAPKLKDDQASADDVSTSAISDEANSFDARLSNKD